MFAENNNRKGKQGFIIPVYVWEEYRGCTTDLQEMLAAWPFPAQNKYAVSEIRVKSHSFFCISSLKLLKLDIQPGNWHFFKSEKMTENPPLPHRAQGSFSTVVVSKLQPIACFYLVLWGTISPTDTNNETMGHNSPPLTSMKEHNSFQRLQ